MGLLRDWCAFAEGKVDTLSIVGLALREAIDWDSEAVMVTIPDWEGAEGLRRFGFDPGGEPLRTVFHAIPPSPLISEEFKDPRAWRLTPAEADGLFI